MIFNKPTSRLAALIRPLTKARKSDICWTVFIARSLMPRKQQFGQMPACVTTLRLLPIYSRPSSLSPQEDRTTPDRSVPLSHMVVVAAEEEDSPAEEGVATDEEDVPPEAQAEDVAVAVETDAEDPQVEEEEAEVVTNRSPIGITPPKNLNLSEEKDEQKSTAYEKAEIHDAGYPLATHRRRSLR